MPRKIRNKKRRDALTSDARCWLEGKSCGFFEFKHDDELFPLWENYGDTENFFWRPGVGRPMPIEDLEAFEELWLNAGDDDDFGGNSFFIYRHYSNSEKLALFESRGDKESYYYRQGMRRPEAVERTQ
jgi:hypothetical protein